MDENFPSIGWKVFIHWLESFHPLAENFSFQPMDGNFPANGWKVFIQWMETFHPLDEKFWSSDLLVWGNGQFNFQVKLCWKAIEGYYEKSEQIIKYFSIFEQSVLRTLSVVLPHVAAIDRTSTAERWTSAEYGTFDRTYLYRSFESRSISGGLRRRLHRTFADDNDKFWRSLQVSRTDLICNWLTFQL